MHARSTTLPVLLPLAFAAGFCLAGCTPSSGPIGRVTGEVTFDGAPVEEGIVSFLNREQGLAAQAALGAGGTFEVRSSAGRGLPPGKYEVAIMPPTVKIPDTAETVGGEGFKEVDNIPQKYRSAVSSGLVAEVSEGTNHLEFAMTSK